MAKLSSTHIYGDLYVDGSIDGKVSKDSAGQQINTTYIKGLSVSGKTITYTKGDGTTGTITTQDTNTTYSAATQSAAGLMSAADKKKLDGVATSANNYSHPNSGVTASSYGPSANASPAHSGTFSVPYITVNAAGHITAASTKTITLPADNNTDTKVTNTLATTTKFYLTGTSSSSTNTGTQYFDTGIYTTTTAGQLQVTGGLISGSAVRSDTAVTDNLGASTVPWKYIYGQHHYINNDATGTNYGRFFVHTAGTTSAVGNGRITLGNSTASGTANNAQGSICLYGSNTGYTIINPGYNSTSSVTLTLPSSTGTIATTANIDSKVANYLPLAGGTMTGAITLNNNIVIKSKTPAAYTNNNTSASVASGTTVNILTYNSSGNCHVNSGAYDNYLSTGSLYLNSPNNLYLRTVNDGGHYIQINGNTVAHFKNDETAFTKLTYAKAGLKSGGNVYSDTAVTDTLGTGALPWKAAYSKQFTVAGEASKTYGYLTTQTVGTTDTVGVCRLSLGNSTASGTASNAKGQILIYGSSSGYTNLTPGNNGTSNIAVTLPSAAGSLPIMSKGDTSYWGMLAPDGGTSWIRTTSSGLIPVDQNGTSALGTSSWPFGNIYGTTIYEGGTSLTNKYAAKSHGTHLTIGTGASNAAAGNHTHNYLTVKGTNTISSTSNDTTAKWGAQQTSIHWYTATGQLTDQPSQWGYIFNVGQGSEVHQIWMTQASGDMLHRGGNGSGWSGSWRKLLDSSNYSSYALPLSGGTMTGNLVVNGNISSKTGIFTYAKANGVATSDGATFVALFRYASSRGICDLGSNSVPGRLYIRSGQGTAGSGVYIENLVNNGNAYMQYLSPEAGTIALTSHLSDRTKKENIVYVGSKDSEFTNKDFYNFIRDDLGLATYNYNKEYNTTDTHTKLNFIAQDILYDIENDCENKVGNLIVQTENAMKTQGNLRYDPEVFTSVIAGALKESINKIEEDNEKIKMLENEIKELEAKNKVLEELVYSMNERLSNLENK